MRKIIALIILFGLSGCAQQFYSKQCLKQFGYALGSTENIDCATNTRRQDMQQSQSDLLGGLLIGGFVAAAQAPQPSLQQSARLAPLVSQSISGYQRICQYLPQNSGYVTVTVGISQQCPTHYSY